MRMYHRKFMGHELFINDVCDRYEDVPVRPHRKKRLRKKFFKKYGKKRVLVASDMFMTKEGQIIIGPAALQKLLMAAELNAPARNFNVCGS